MYENKTVFGTDFNNFTTLYERLVDPKDLKHNSPSISTRNISRKCVPYNIFGIHRSSGKTAYVAEIFIVCIIHRSQKAHGTFLCNINLVSFGIFPLRVADFENRPNFLFIHMEKPRFELMKLTQIKVSTYVSTGAFGKSPF